jgi:hypothetical protein
VRVEHPDALDAETLAQKFAALGDPQRAFQVGLEPALSAKDFARALALADAAGERAHAERVLWRWADHDVTAVPLERLVGIAGADRARVLELLEKVADGVEISRWVRPIVEDASGDVELRARALRLLVRRGEAAELIAQEWPKAQGDWLGSLRWIARSLPPLAQHTLYTQVARQDDEELQLERLGAARMVGDAQLIAGTLDVLAGIGAAPARAARLLEAAELLREGAPLEGAARVKLALALAPAVPGVIDAALRELDGGGTETFLPLLEKARAQVTGGSAVRLRNALIRLYEGLGQTERLYQLLGECEPTREVLVQRAKLAGALGRKLDALQLREQLSESAGELEEILADYLVLRALPQARTLTERLWRAGTLSPHGARLAAERFSSAMPEAALACELWPSLVRERLDDIDGWTVYAEALRVAGHAEASERIDAFGAVLSGTRLQPPGVRIGRLERSPVTPVAAPEGVIAIQPETMPRLAPALRTVLDGLGAENTRVWLHAIGGLEAYAISQDELVLGADALTAFGPVELGYLLALALALGDAGRALATTDAIDGFTEAAAKAFAAVPSTGAALRVIALLDPSVRGSDPARVDLAAVLRQSDAFRAVARKALDLV